MALIGGLYNWPMRRGDDETLVLTLPDEISPVGRTYSCQIRTVEDFVVDPGDGRLLATASVDVVGQDVNIAFTHDDTMLLRGHVDTWYSLRETHDSDGHTDTLIAGKVTISTSATELVDP